MPNLTTHTTMNNSTYEHRLYYKGKLYDIFDIETDLWTEAELESVKTWPYLPIGLNNKMAECIARYVKPPVNRPDKCRLILRVSNGKLVKFKSDYAKRTQALTICIPPRITRAFIKAHSHITFIYGDTLHHDGIGKQAFEARGEPNAYPIPHKKCKCYNDNSCFWRDEELEVLFKPALERHLSLVSQSNNKVIFFPKIVLGFSEMDKRCPMVYKYMVETLNNTFIERSLNLV